MNGWEKTRQLAERCSSGEHVQLKNDKDTIVGAFCGEPHPRPVHWVGSTAADCTDDDKCQHCAKSTRRSMRAVMNFYVLAERKMKKIEGGAEWFKSLEAAKEKYPLDASAFEVKRHGKANDQKTKYSILFERTLTEEEKKRIAATPLLELASSGGADDADDEPLSPKVFEEFRARLKALPRDVSFAFLGKFGAERISDLRASDEARARAVLTEIERARAPAPSDELDPLS